MILIEGFNAYNFENAVRGSRNPMNSWDKSDSFYSLDKADVLWYNIGEGDMKLLSNLSIAGSDHRKFMRQIFVSMDITAPLYWWKEMDTYKVGTTANSCSTMHKLSTTPITKDCFSFDGGVDELKEDDFEFFLDTVVEVDMLENLRTRFLQTKDIRYWRALVQKLPASWNQLRTWTADYEVLHNIYHARSNHKLSEWVTFCNFIETVPYAKEIILHK